MNTKDTGSGALFIKRIEELLERSTLPPEKVLNIMRTSPADPKADLLSTLERLQNEQQQTE